jgi:hypothetical protein
VLCVQAERAALEKAVDEEIAAEAAADEEAKQQKREQIAAEERRLAEIEEQRQAEVGTWGVDQGLTKFVDVCCVLNALAT